jgi:integrase
MRLDSRLQKSRHGIYYLRIQRAGIDRKWSLRTRDPAIAEIAAYEFSAKLLRMTKDFNLLGDIAGFQLISDGKNVTLITEDNDPDREAGNKAFAMLLEHQSKLQNQPQYAPPEQPKSGPVVTFETALTEYEVDLAFQPKAVKSKRMAISTLKGLKNLLGADFDMAELVDDVIEDCWIDWRKSQVSEDSAKRDLSFIRSFVEWAADRKKQYCKVALTISIKTEAQGQHYEYLDKNDLKLIFDKLPEKAQEPWQFWVVILGLYSGARIGEIASMQTEYVSVKSELNIMRLHGTKTLGSDRTIPIHQDLINIGFLDYVESRRKAKKELLFDIRQTGQNGPGAQASKYFSEFKSDIGLTHPNKAFASFRHTITDVLNQANVNEKAGSQYTGHSGSNSVRSKVYGRKPISLDNMHKLAVSHIDWNKYCGWSPDVAILKAKADQFIQ